MRPVLIALIAAALAAPTNAWAAPDLSVDVERQAVRYGGAHKRHGYVR